jgi:RNA polymerase sigma factor (sigma-70 family)
MAEAPTGSRSAKAANDEISDLYAALAVRLRQIVGAQVRAPDALIEDACQFAWSNLIRYQGSVARERALGWLATTASREAIRLIRRQRRDLSLEQLTEDGSGSAPRAAVTSIEELVEQRARLQTIDGLPERQQRLVWLQGLGLSYNEMAAHEGATPRTVERQLIRAKKRLREAA